jgi:hypothetical protein
LAYFNLLKTAQKNPIKPVKTHPKNPWVGGFLKKPTHLTTPVRNWKLEEFNCIYFAEEFPKRTNEKSNN